MTRGLLDTSVFIARERERPLEALPPQVAISVVTLAELELGVLVASSPEARAIRADTLGLARAADPLPITESTMSCFARIVADCRASGRKPKVLDALIAATGIDHGLPIITQDSDFDAIAEVHGRLDVLRV